MKFLAIIPIIALVLSGYFFYQNQKLFKNTKVSEVINLEISGWKKYFDIKNGFSFQYPSEYIFDNNMITPSVSGNFGAISFGVNSYGDEYKNNRRQKPNEVVDEYLRRLSSEHLFNIDGAKSVYQVVDGIQTIAVTSGPCCGIPSSNFRTFFLPLEDNYLTLTLTPIGKVTKNDPFDLDNYAVFENIINSIRINR